MADKPLTLETIFNGEAMAQFQNAQEEVLENLMDISTDWKAKRKITVEIVYQCRDEEREQVLTALTVRTKVEGQKPVGEVMSIGREKVQGELKPVAYAMARGNKNQVAMFQEKDGE